MVCVWGGGDLFLAAGLAYVGVPQGARRMVVRMTAAEYRAFALSPQSEEGLQASVLATIREEFPHLCVRVGLEGARLSPRVAAKMKAQGMERGWPDLTILGPNRLMGFIELKFGKNTESPQQKEVRAKLEAMGFPCAVCWSIAEVKRNLTQWSASHAA